MSSGIWLNWFFRIDLFWRTFRGRWRAANSIERFPADTISVRTPIAGTTPAPTAIAYLRVTDQQRSNRHGQEKRSGHRINVSSRTIALRGLSLRTPAPCRLCLGRGTEPALAFSAPTLVVTVLHDNAIIISAAGLVIDALALSVDVAFDRTTGWKMLVSSPFGGEWGRFAGRGAHRFGSRINFSETRLKFRGKNWVPQND